MAIPLFVKVSPYVAKKMQLDQLRFKTADGNYLLRQSDMMVFGPLFRLEEHAARIGGVVLRDSEAAANQRGEVNTPLPVPTDPEFIDPEPVSVMSPEGTDVTEETDEAGEGGGDEQ